MRYGGGGACVCTRSKYTAVSRCLGIAGGSGASKGNANTFFFAAIDAVGRGILDVIYIAKDEDDEDEDEDDDDAAAGADAAATRDDAARAECLESIELPEG